MKTSELSSAANRSLQLHGIGKRVGGTTRLGDINLDYKLREELRVEMVK